jgi:hypothetical protein
VGGRGLKKCVYDRRLANIKKSIHTASRKVINTALGAKATRRSVTKLKNRLGFAVVCFVLDCGFCAVGWAGGEMRRHRREIAAFCRKHAAASPKTIADFRR